MNYYIIGSREVVLAFKMIGVTGAVVENRAEALEAFNRVTGKGGFGNIPTDEHPKIVILSEDVASLIESEEVEWQKTGKFPLIVEVPGINGHIEGRKTLTDSIREAIGINI